jgi:NAD(P)-dependent dehydrogenase (short-subunit alcohol dehydrogenase family)
VFGLHAKAAGMRIPEFQNLITQGTHRRRLTDLDELAAAAVFAASDAAGGMTGAVINLTGGAVVD